MSTDDLTLFIDMIKERIKYMLHEEELLAQKIKDTTIRQDTIMSERMALEDILDNYLAGRKLTASPTKTSTSDHKEWAEE